MQTASQVLSSFKEKFSTQPRVFFSPGRINLIGEHIDYNDGYVMPAAINKGIWFAIALNNTGTANFFAVDVNESFSVAINNVVKEDGWKNYVLGILHVLLKEDYGIPGFDCAFGGNVPLGAGLSSSAALEAGLLYALNELFDYGISTGQMAKYAQQAEHAFPGTKCGIMDMFASLHGKKNQCFLLDCVTLQYEYLPLQFDNYELVLINTKVHHNLNDGGYNRRRDEAMEGLSFFHSVNKKITSFRHITSTVVEQFSYALSNDVYRRCMFISKEIERVQLAAKALQDNDLIEFGKLMYQTHTGLSTLYDVSCPELDFLVDEAKGYFEVIGSRLMGGGFGGCTINLVDKYKREEVISKIVDAYERKFNIVPEVYVVETSDGTHELDVNKL